MDIRDNLTSETVEHAYPTPPLAVHPQTTVRQALELMKAEHASCLLVCQQGRLEGIFTERDALRLLASEADLDTPLERVMVRQPSTVHRTVTVAEAMQKMTSGGYRRLPIVDEQHRPTGLVSVKGMIRYLCEHFPRVVYNQPPVAHPITHQREGP
jgi:CBS domain-containing protein